MSFVGTCQSFCSDKELQDRRATGQLSEFERNPWKPVASYLRSAGGRAVLPEEVRTPAVLVATARYLLGELLEAVPLSACHAFIGDRLRSVRQEASVQQAAWVVGSADHSADHTHAAWLRALLAMQAFHIACAYQIGARSASGAAAASGGGGGTDAGGRWDAMLNLHLLKDCVAAAEAAAEVELQHCLQRASASATTGSSDGSHASALHTALECVLMTRSHQLLLLLHGGDSAECMALLRHTHRLCKRTGAQTVAPQAVAYWQKAVRLLLAWQCHGSTRYAGAVQAAGSRHPLLRALAAAYTVPTARARTLCALCSAIPARLSLPVADVAGLLAFAGHGASASADAEEAAQEAAWLQAAAFSSGLGLRLIRDTDGGTVEVALADVLPTAKTTATTSTSTSAAAAAAATAPTAVVAHADLKLTPAKPGSIPLESAAWGGGAITAADGVAASRAKAALQPVREDDMDTEQWWQPQPTRLAALVCAHLYSDNEV